MVNPPECLLGSSFLRYGWYFYGIGAAACKA